MIRRYSHTDKPSVIDLLRKNTPEYFALTEEEDLNHYLDNEAEYYIVYEENNTIIGAGGINFFPQEKLARMSWDIIDPNYHGKGIGKILMQHRFNHLSENPNIDFIVVRTTQLVYKFYAKMGFTLERIKKDYWAKGFDLYEMKMQIKSIL